MCNVKCTGEIPWKEHVEGIRNKLTNKENSGLTHQRKLAKVGKQPENSFKKPKFHYEMCNVTVSDESIFKGHLIGRPHARRLKKAHKIETITLE